MCVCVCVSHSVMSICAPMDCDPPASSVHGILQARVLEWLPFSSPLGLGGIIQIKSYLMYVPGSCHRAP